MDSLRVLEAEVGRLKSRLDELERFNVLVRNSQDIVTILDADGMIVYESPAAEQILGYRPDELVGQVIFDFIHPQDLDVARGAFRSALAEPGNPLSAEARFRHKDGTWHVLHGIGVNLLHDPTIQGIVVNSRDISDRQQMEQALRSSEARYRALVELCPDTVAVRQQGKIVYINPAGLSLLGASDPEQIIGRSMLDFVHPDYQAEVRERLQQPVNEYRNPVFRPKLIGFDGNVIDVELIASATEHEGAAAELLVIRDVTDRLGIQTELERLYGLSIDMMGTAGIDGYFKSLNQAWSRTLGYSIPELLAQPFIEFVHPDDRAATLMVIEGMQQGRSAIQFENRYQHKDGSYRWLAWNAVAFTAQGVAYFVARDITEQKLSYEQTQEQNRRLLLLNKLTRIATSALDMQALLKTLAKTAPLLIGADACYITQWDEDHRRVVHAAATGITPLVSSMPRASEEGCLTEAVLLSNQPIVIEDVLKSSYASPDVMAEFPARSMLAVPLVSTVSRHGVLMLGFNEPHAFTEDEVLWCVQGAELISLAMSRLRNYQELEVRNAELDAFSHTVAHDLKSPLSLIIGYIGMVDEAEIPDLPEIVTNALAVIKERTKRMDDMIDSLLLLASLRSPAEAISRVEMRPVIEAAISRFETAISQKGITVEIEPALPAALGNAGWLEEAFANLIGNAIKYLGTHQTEPQIIIRGTTQESRWVRYEVQDNGLGIKPEDQQRLFEMFSRFHPKEASGSGLGLSIVKRIIEKLGGGVGVSSSPGEGSVFWFVLPAPSL